MLALLEFGLAGGADRECARVVAHHGEAEAESAARVMGPGQAAAPVADYELDLFVLEVGVQADGSGLVGGVGVLDALSRVEGKRSYMSARALERCRSVSTNSLIDRPCRERDRHRVPVSHP